MRARVAGNTFKRLSKTDVKFNVQSIICELLKKKLDVKKTFSKTISLNCQNLDLASFCRR